MNRQRYRLVFCRRVAMLVAVAENAASQRKTVTGERRGVATALVWALASSLSLAGTSLWAQTRPPVVFASALPPPSANLPVPYGSTFLPNGNRVNATPRPFAFTPSDGANAADLATIGAVSWSVQGKNAVFDQGNVDRVILNWDSFDVGAGYTLHFKQNQDPAKYVSALNRIWSADPTRIFGALSADREVILLNANGVYFGRGARVDTGKFVASALSIADSVFDKGLRNVTDGSAVLTGAGTDYLPTNLNSAVTVEAGAQLRSAAGGDVLLFAPRVSNRGRIETPSGQTVLAAGDKVYLMSSSDPRQRGLIVAVDPVAVNGSIDSQLGIVENLATGSFKTVDGAAVDDATDDATTGLVQRLNEIRAERGSINLVGLTVRQQGAVNATTAVKGANGTIYLQAMASTDALQAGATTVFGSAGARGLSIEASTQVRVGADLGTVEVGAGSITAVSPESSASTQLDAEVFNPSLIQIQGKSISVGSGALVQAPGGTISITAAANSIGNPLFDRSANILLTQPDGSRIVVSPGATISAAGLSQVQLDGARNQGAQRLFSIELADSPVQRDGPLYRSEVFFDLRDGSKITLANLSGAATAVGRSAAERTAIGGSVELEAQGAVVLGQDSTIDVSGGSVHYSEALLQQSLVVRDGNVMAFSTAKPGNTIDELSSLVRRSVAPAYTEGQDGGTLSISGRQVALDGALRGQVVQGERQRDGTSVRAVPSTLAVGRSIGNQNSIATLALHPHDPTPTGSLLFADPLNAPLSAMPATAALSLTSVREGGFGGLRLRADAIDQTQFGTLNLGIGGTLDAVATNTLSLNGVFLVPGGRINLQTLAANIGAANTGQGDIRVSGSTRLEAGGLWTNDRAGLGDGAGGPVQMNGGSIRVAASNALTIAPGAALDVSAGAWLGSTGVPKTGTAGSIALSAGILDNLASPGAGLSIAGATLSGFDFDQGGSLALGAPDLTVSNGSGDAFVLTPAFFSAHGFGDITVNANGDIRVASGSVLVPVLANWLLASTHLSMPSGPMTAAVVTALPLDTRLTARAPVNLTLNAKRDLLFGGASVDVERGATIALEPGGSLTLAATRDVRIGETGGQAGQTTELTARGGKITLAISGVRGSDNDPASDSVGFLGDQSIWLGDAARLSVSGIAQLRPDPRPPMLGSVTATSSGNSAGQRMTGTVLGGGSITLLAQRGYVVTAAGSAISLDGIRALRHEPGLADPVTLAMPAGTLIVSTPEGFAMDGHVSAQAPTDANGRPLADGGALTLRIGLGGTQTGTTAANKYPDDPNQPVAKPRTVVVGAFDGQLAASGSRVDSDLSRTIDNGVGYVRTSVLTDAGFSALALGAGNTIRFDHSLNLTMPRSIVLDAPAIAAAPYARLHLHTGYAQLGDALPARLANAQPDRMAVADFSATSATSLTVTAPTIALYGSWGLQGFSQVLLDAGSQQNGEISLTSSAFGVPLESLAFAGRLELAAGQVYTTSGVQTTLNGIAATGPGDPGSSLVIRTGSTGASAQAPLSAFGALHANATRIEQSGVLRQPFGSIALAAERDLVLGDNSVTSVSGDGATLSFGQTTNLATWNLPDGTTGNGLPRPKSVQLSGARVHTAASASVSASGGGTVQAWEFFPGVGGSKDYFETPGLYAVLPDHPATQALLGNGSALPGLGQIVVTMAGSGLAPGIYSLLPARHALIGGGLPHGAFLVSRAADQGRTTLAVPLQQDDGSTIVTGYLRAPGSINVGAPGERFVVEPAATYRAKSDIRLTDVSSLLAANAETLGSTITPALPRDAGQVQVIVTGTDSSIWQARVDLHANGGKAGLLDMSATRLALVDDPAKSPVGALGVRASVIADSGVGSVLLGGNRSQSIGADGKASLAWTIDQRTTSDVTVDIGTAPFQVEELLLAASGSITLAPGTFLAAATTGTLGPRTLTSNGDGTLLAVSANPLKLLRTGTTQSAGDLMVGAGSVLTARQIGLDATRLLQVDSNLALQAQALDLGARNLVLGSGTLTELAASVFAGDLLAGIRNSHALSLRGYAGIDFVGSQNWSQRPDVDNAHPDPAPTSIMSQLVLDAPVIRGLDAADGTPAYTDIAARSVELRNTSGTVADPSATGQGKMILQAVPPAQFGTTGGMQLGTGAVALAFDDAALRSNGDIVLSGQGSTHAQRELTLSAARVTATSAAQQSIVAQGDLMVTPLAGSHTLGERVGQGAAVRLQGHTVAQSGLIDLPGGALSIQASGTRPDGTAIRFDAGSRTSVAGFVIHTPREDAAFGSAGTLRVDAALGRIAVLGTLDASAARRSNGAAGDSDAGRIALSAAGIGGQLVLDALHADGSVAQGALIARAGSSAQNTGGRLDVDVQTMASADALAAAALEGGIVGSFALRVRNGDVGLTKDISAERILIGADGGALSLAGAKLEAHAAAGGVVQLAASGDLQLDNGVMIDARSIRTGANGGDVLVSSANGWVRLAATTRIDSSGDDLQDGRIVLRAQRGSDNASVNVDPIVTANLLAGELNIEAVRDYRTVTVGGVTREIASIATGNSAITGSGVSSSGRLGQTTVRNDSASFMAAQASILGALGVATQDNERVHLRVGVQVLASGDLTVSSDWQLANDRPGGDAGFLTLRAVGDLTINGSISDGFSSTTNTGVLNNNSRSWSYRIAAGADLQAANPLTLRDPAGSADAFGDLTVAAGRMLRTGAGSIELAASRDIAFVQGAGNTAQGMAYVAGRKAADPNDVLTGLFAAQSAKPTFTEKGGRLELLAGRDIRSAEATQLINNWLWRSGIPVGDVYSNSSQLGWWTEFSRFRQSLGSFGGGNILVEAGRDIVNLQAVAPTAGWANSKTIAQAALQVRNGGDLTVTAGRDLLGGQFLVGRGGGRLQSSGNIGAATENVRAQNPLLALMDGSWDVSARADVTIGAAFNPTAIPVSASDNRAVFSPYFYTWGADAAVHVNSTAGDVRVYGELNTGSDLQRFGLNTSGVASPQNLLQVLPASLRVTAASGDVHLFTVGLANAILFPSTLGTLQVWSGGNLTLGSTIAMADSNPALWPDFASPVPVSGFSTLIGTGSNGLLPGTLANTLGATSLRVTDPAPVRLHAELAISAANAARAATLVLPKAAEISAGTDILGLQLEGQNLRASDTTRIAAERNFLAGQYGNIILAGPGALEITAGRQLDLENSQGVATIGNLGNAKLPAQGASVLLSAATVGRLDLAALEASYLRDAAQGGSARAEQYRAMLLSYVRAALVLPNLDYAQARSLFQDFPAAAQTILGRQVLAAEFAAVYLNGPTPTTVQMVQSLHDEFERHKATILQAGASALATGQGLALPGREVLKGGELTVFLAAMQVLAFDNLDIDATVAARVASLSQVRQGWRDAVASSLGNSAAALDALALLHPQSADAIAYRDALASYRGPLFRAYQATVLAAETASAGSAAAQFGVQSLPMRLALFDQGFQAAELAGVGSFVAHPIWSGPAPLFDYAGALNMTQSSVVTQRGGDISLVNPGGAINVGLKQIDGADSSAATGVIALGDGNVFGYAKADFQVNTQRVFVVGNGDMNIWSSNGDIDSGRGANTAVAAPPLVARRSADGVVFELPATTTGSGLGILEDAAGNRSGTIGLFPAFGEILALDAFIRAPTVVLGASIKGADNLQAASVGGAAAPVSAPTLAVAAPPTSESRSVESQNRQTTQQERTRNALLTVELLGMGPAAGDEECSEQDQLQGKCTKETRTCSDADKANGLCR